MSTIVWVLVVIASGMYAMPVPVRVTFQTEQECLRAASTVEVNRKPVEIRCEPKAVPATGGKEGE